jgi:hypothetical protein
MNQNICPYFIRGICKYGNNCHYLHIIPNQNQNNQNQQAQNQNFNQNLNQKQQHICRFFMTPLKNPCKNSNNCQYFHGYGFNLQNEVSLGQFDSEITNLLKISNEMFLISTKNNTLKLYQFTPKLEEKPFQLIQGIVIKKILFSNNLFIIISEEGAM